MGPSSVSSSVFPVPDQHHKRYIVRHQQRRNPECRYPIRGPHGSRSSVLIGDAVRFFPQHFACSRRETSTTYPVLLRLFARALMCSLYIGTSGPAPVVIRRLHKLAPSLRPLCPETSRLAGSKSDMAIFQQLRESRANKRAARSPPIFNSHLEPDTRLLINERIVNG